MINDEIDVNKFFVKQKLVVCAEGKQGSFINIVQSVNGICGKYVRDG